MVVVFGSVNLDLVAQAARIPAPGETLAGSGFTMAPGGKGANQALAARRAGARVVLFGAVGDDAFASAAVANLAAAGVELGLARAPVSTGVALITVDARGENAITVVAGANAHARAAQVPDAALVRGNTLLMQLEVPSAEVVALATRAHARGVRVVVNAAPALPLARGLLRDLDVLVVNEHEARICAGRDEAPEAFVARMHRELRLDSVVTLGARGALTRDALVSAPRVEVVDTTGAGDAFAGALTAALDAGATLRDAVAAGVAAGTACCAHRGAQG